VLFFSAADVLRPNGNRSLMAAIWLAGCQSMLHQIPSLFATELIVSTGKPTGVMRTEKQYENFEIELDWKHIVPGGNAGLFVWSDPVTAQGQPFTARD
jgi:hypothetical protein